MADATNPTTRPSWSSLVLRGINDVRVPFIATTALALLAKVTTRGGAWNRVGNWIAGGSGLAALGLAAWSARSGYRQEVADAAEAAEAAQVARVCGDFARGIDHEESTPFAVARWLSTEEAPEVRAELTAGRPRDANDHVDPEAMDRFSQGLLSQRGVEDWEALQFSPEYVRALFAQLHCTLQEPLPERCAARMVVTAFDLVASVWHGEEGDFQAWFGLDDRHEEATIRRCRLKVPHHSPERVRAALALLQGIEFRNPGQRDDPLEQRDRGAPLSREGLCARAQVWWARAGEEEREIAAAEVLRYEQRGRAFTPTQQVQEYAEALSEGKEFVVQPEELGALLANQGWQAEVPGGACNMGDAVALERPAVFPDRFSLF